MSSFDVERLISRNEDLIRIEKVIPFEIEHEIYSDTIWFENHNIEKCIETTHKLGLTRIHLQTDNIDFLEDPRLNHVTGISMQFEINNIKVLYNYKKLTYLGLPSNIKVEFDFSNFKELNYLSGELPEKYINLNQLTNLKYTYLFNYRKKDLADFSNCLNLRELCIISLSIENLTGIAHLENLTKLDLTNCRRLISLEGIGFDNKNLKTIYLENCKNLKNADSLKDVVGLERLRLLNIFELDNLDFLRDLPNLEYAAIHPKNVGVKFQNYYPLIDTLKRIQKLETLKGWKPLKSYLDNTFIISTPTIDDKSELQLIKSNLPLMTWIEKSEDGLKQYSKKNCKKAELLIINLIDRLEHINSDDLRFRENLIRDCVLELNAFNDSLDGSFIETEEREQLCDIFDNIADAVGLDVQSYPDGIASKWREW